MRANDEEPVAMALSVVSHPGLRGFAYIPFKVCFA